MIITKLKLLMLHMMLVAGTGGRAVRGSLNKVVANDLRVVFTALDRSNPHKLELTSGALNTTFSTTRFVQSDMDRIKEVMAVFTELDLTGMNLTQLPTYGIQMMGSLKTLILDNNRGLELTPEVIRMISQLPIKRVSIRNSSISLGTLKAFQELPYLTELDISGNESLSRHMDDDKFGNLTTRLVKLNVSGCRLHGNWLDAILRCINLKVLNASKNANLFENNVPSATYSFMRGLNSLDVSWCSLDNAWLSDIPECTNLTDLDISYNNGIGLKAANFSKFVNLKLLKRLKASQCDLTIMSLNEICKSGAIEELSIGSNAWLWLYLFGNVEVDFGTCRESLKILKVDATELDENGLRALCGLPNKVDYEGSIWKTTETVGFPNLTILDIGFNPALAPLISQKNFRFWCLEKTLTELTVSGIGIETSNVFRVIERCENLIKLDISFNTGIWEDARNNLSFGYLKSRLQVLNVESTGLPPGILFEILWFNQLEELNISLNDGCCQDLGSNNWVLGGTKNTLKRIDVGGTGLTGEGLRWIFNEFTGLEKVNAIFNRHIRPADLTGLSFDPLKSRLVEFRISTDDWTAAELRRRLPRTIISSF